MAPIDLDTIIADAVADTREDFGAAEDLQAQLLAGIGLAIAVSARGDARAANAMCERASVMIFEQAASVSLMLAADGRV
ncbi:hypothetical protein [Methylobacterium radiodurans]|uniref:Uncharacterized protein n=1 Tax=Methylobacterium radiodurans TaxID=2202828 RepID=A0A2U8VR37_9HYPH|nr:hypothetical protein [Methylobacterium radiodurans]AWN35762.1 hypothetical protein DK427_08395 [Methylobacterium radiodurans]